MEPTKRPIINETYSSPASFLNKEDENKKATKTHSFIGSLKIILTYLLADLKKKQRSFKIGLITVLLVTSCITILTSGIYISPLIFMKLAENDVGEIDTVLNPSVGTNRTELNLPNALTYFFILKIPNKDLI